MSSFFSLYVDNIFFFFFACPIVPLLPWLLLLGLILSSGSASAPCAYDALVSGLSRNYGWPRIKITWFCRVACTFVLWPKQSKMSSTANSQPFVAPESPYCEYNYRRRSTYFWMALIKTSLPSWTLGAMLRGNRYDGFPRCFHTISYTQTSKQPPCQVAAKVAAWSVPTLHGVWARKTNTAAQKQTCCFC